MVVVVVVFVVLHLHRVNKGGNFFIFFLRVIFDEESIGDGLEAQKILLIPLLSFLGQLPLPQWGCCNSLQETLSCYGELCPSNWDGNFFGAS